MKHKWKELVVERVLNGENIFTFENVEPHGYLKLKRDIYKGLLVKRNRSDIVDLDPHVDLLLRLDNDIYNF